MERLLTPLIAKDLEKKMVFLAGPRQVGKTFLAKSLSSRWPQLFYINFDSDSGRRVFLKGQWDRKSPLVVMDEVHKWPKWKTLLKGVYDTEGIPPRILVTGSARLNVYRRGGDSLAGRYFLYHLYPLTVAELKKEMNPAEALEKLMRYGGFPEPFLAQDEQEAARWRKSMIDTVVREDIRDLEPITKIQSLFLLIDLLRERVGSTISYSSLAEDIHVSPHTVKHWIDILETMYLVFRVTPFTRNIARAVLKEPKIYFFDTGMVRGNVGALYENIIALSIKKHLHFLQDTEGQENSLHYIRDKEKREVDFVIAVNRKAQTLIETKVGDETVSGSLLYYKTKLGSIDAVQVVKNIGRSLTIDGVQIENAAEWLSRLSV
jgi:predicted AAA+ superfamily ATPase